MGQNKKISILPSILIICLMIAVFAFVVFQNIVQADIIEEDQVNGTISDFLENNLNKFIESNIQIAKDQYAQNFDTESDYSFQKYVSDKNMLQNKKYEPIDLVAFDTGNIVNKSSRPYLRQAAATAFNSMTQAFFENFGEKIYVASSYRTYQDQVKLFNEGCTTVRCAKIGSSEHQLGLAVDIHVATKKGYTRFSSGYLDWMNENAYKYGFINTYRKGPQIDGKMNEIRHWRYVGVPLATQLYEKDMSFAEWISSNEE